MDPTRRLLLAATDRTGRNALAWAAEPVRDRTVLELTPHEGSIGDTRFGGPAIPVPLPDNAADAAMILLALPRLPDLDAAFAELRRVLRPSATLVVLVPSAARRSVAELLSPLGAAHRAGWPHRSALDRTSWLLAAADFAVLGDDRLPFTLAGATAPELRAAGFWPPAGPPIGVPGRLPVPLRRVVARR